MQPEQVSTEPGNPVDWASVSSPFDYAGFNWSVFVGQFATKGTAFVGWEPYLELNREALRAEYQKGAGPAILHATSLNGGRRVVDISHTNAIVVDIDEELTDWSKIERLMAAWRAAGVSYLCQRRWAGVWKTHLVLPFAKPYGVVDAGRVREVNMDFIARFSPAKNDAATCGVYSLCYCMTKRPNREDPESFEYTGPNALDYDKIFPTWKQRPVAKRAPRILSPEESDHILKHLTVLGYVPDKEAWDIECPVGHERDTSKKTLFFPTGHISCMAGRCLGKPLAWFLSHLGEDLLESAPSVVRLAEARDQQSVAAAHQTMAETFREVRPTERGAAVVKITTGAGKTHAVSNYLNVYSEPIEGLEGKTSVLAVPTNALLREVQDRITIPFAKKTGVLAVLNNDGTFACRKHRVAKSLQDSGGNVHRLLCSRCEWREDCPARLGASSGSGPLTLTNHSLMAGTARALHEAGRYPLLVWDESPTWVQQSVVPLDDVAWLNQEVQRKIDPDDLFTSMFDGPIFNPQRVTAIRPVLELSKWMASLDDFTMRPAGPLIDQWLRLPINQAYVERAQAQTGYVDLADLARWSPHTNESEQGFDQMTKSTQTRVLRSEQVLRNLMVTTATGGWVTKRDGHLFVGALTENAATFRSYGGLVLDATADVTAMKALRPDLRVKDISVQDSDGIQRYMHVVTGLGRKSMKSRPQRLKDVVGHARSALNRLRCRKPVVFSYRFSLDVIRVLWPEAELCHYGNVRGYDRYFQEGYDGFVTLGEPIANLQAVAIQWKVLTGRDPDDSDMEWRRFVEATAESELAQAHGRARDPQKSDGLRVHLHYGKIVPAGWDSGTTALDPLTFTD